MAGEIKFPGCSYLVKLRHAYAIVEREVFGRGKVAVEHLTRFTKKVLASYILKGKSLLSAAGVIKGDPEKLASLANVVDKAAVEKWNADHDPKRPGPLSYLGRLFSPHLRPN
ncbi:MAG: hypothetical protein AB7E52_00745 [Bdellovibrionales bacterium]